MNYYDPMLEVQRRQADAARERKHRALVAEAHKANHANRRPRLIVSFRLRLPRRQPEQPCPTCPEYA